MCGAENQCTGIASATPGMMGSHTCTRAAMEALQRGAQLSLGDSRSSDRGSLPKEGSKNLERELRISGRREEQTGAAAGGGWGLFRKTQWVTAKCLGFTHHSAVWP